MASRNGLAGRLGKLEQLVRAGGRDCARCRGRGPTYVNDWRATDGHAPEDPGRCPACGRGPSTVIEYVQDWRQQGGEPEST